MNTQEKVQMLTGALAVILHNSNDSFIRFETLTAEQAEKMIISNDFCMGVTSQGNLWIGSRAYFGTRYVFADKSLAVIANA